MRIVGRYSHNDGEECLRTVHPQALAEIEQVLSCIDAESCRLKRPKNKEIKRAERANVTHFYSPIHLNALFDWHFFRLRWDVKPRIKTTDSARSGYREMDFLKDHVGVEVQFGKYSFLTYDIIAKLVIFRNLEIIDCAVEVCVMASMLPFMSSGIGAFEQVVWDLKHRGVADIDVPVLLLGCESEAFDEPAQSTRQLPLIEMTGDPEICLGRYTSKGLSKGTIQKVRETGLDI